MKTKVYAVAEKVPPYGSDGFEPGRLYAVTGEDEDASGPGTFNAIGDGGRGRGHRWASPNYGWTRLVLPDIDPRDVAELIEAARGMWTVAAGAGDYPKLERLTAILNKIEGDE
ncbi:MAG: hypothetical protein VYB54_04835 [Pseudomonadota bacterium]|nr:hypothetical protein [Pseudomonadota bacterium]